MPAIDIHSPLRDAVSQMASRRVTPSGMTSREWEALQAEIRLRSMFSATVENERVLVEMKERLNAGISNQKTGGATMDRGRFVEEMRGIIQETGYKRPDGIRKSSVRNLRSRARLELIWNMNMAQGVGYAQWKAAMDPDMLYASPCYELVRIMPKREIRDWPLVWGDHGGQFYGKPGKDYPDAEGRMIAPKTDLIWRWISRFKTPWPPFDWGSGMGLRNVRRAEAIALGVIKEDEELIPQDLPFNHNASASLEGIPESRRQAIVRDLAGDVEIQDDRLVITAPARISHLPRIPAALASVTATAAATAAAWTAAEQQAIMAVVSKTVAFIRLKNQIEQAGGSLTVMETLTRALLQFLANPDEQAAIAEIRRGPFRDVQWTELDFREIRRAIAKQIGGAA